MVKTEFQPIPQHLPPLDVRDVEFWQRLMQKFGDPGVVGTLMVRPICEGSTKKGDQCKNKATGVIEFRIPGPGDWDYIPSCRTHKDAVLERVRQDLEKAGRPSSFSGTIGFKKS